MFQNRQKNPKAKFFFGKKPKKIPNQMWVLGNQNPEYSDSKVFLPVRWYQHRQKNHEIGGHFRRIRSLLIGQNHTLGFDEIMVPRRSSSSVCLVHTNCARNRTDEHLFVARYPNHRAVLPDWFVFRTLHLVYVLP